MKLQRYAKNPILSPNPQNDWENLVTANPGVWYDEQQHKVYMLYRAAGDENDHKIYLGLAVSENGFDFARHFDRPVFSPAESGFDAGCVEDPRIVKMGDYFYITYAARPFPPGRYWLNEAGQPNVPDDLPPEFPAALRHNKTSTGLAITKDFKKFYRAGRLTNPVFDDRDVILFPEKINGTFYMLHRPMELVGKDYGSDYPSIWIASGTDLLNLHDSRILAKSSADWEQKIGGNTPPIRTDHGWLTLYHGVGPDKRYRIGAMLLGLENPTKLTHRSRDWLLQPEELYELEGFYPGVVFPCGKVVIDGTLFVYYGGADKYIGLATCWMDELLDYLLSCPVSARTV
ncbi:glycosidase [candidate division KSB1 bacterium]|nr:glycosidase [candidate division KSB1 bacterium]